MQGVLDEGKKKRRDKGDASFLSSGEQYVDPPPKSA